MPDSPDLDKGAAHLAKAHAFRRKRVEKLESEIEALRAQVATLQDEQRLLDGVVRVLGIEDDSITPAEEAARILAENAALRAKLADCQSVIRSRGHDADCPAVATCAECGQRERDFNHYPRHPILGKEHRFRPGPCSDACGYTRTTGEKS